MKKIILSLILLAWISPVLAVEVDGVKIDPQVEVAGEMLTLNGYGIRTKFFFDIYIGSLYTSQKVTSAEQAVAAEGGKLIRMDFLYKKVEKQKIIDAFAEGIAKNSPALANTTEARTFLGWFDADFVKQDRVDLIIAAEGMVSATHNGRQLGSVNSPQLAKGVLLIYLGEKPADSDMEKGMLGVH
jgi:hypothetical protein